MRAGASFRAVRRRAPYDRGASMKNRTSLIVLTVLLGALAQGTSSVTGALTIDNPLKLTYTAAAVKIDRTITVDRDDMFTLSDVVTNTGATPITPSSASTMKLSST